MNLAGRNRIGGHLDLLPAIRAIKRVDVVGQRSADDALATGTSVRNVHQFSRVAKVREADESRVLSTIIEERQTQPTVGGPPIRPRTRRSPRHTRCLSHFAYSESSAFRV